MLCAKTRVVVVAVAAVTVSHPLEAFLMEFLSDNPAECIFYSLISPNSAVWQFLKYARKMAHKFPHWRVTRDRFPVFEFAIEFNSDSFMESGRKWRFNVDNERPKAVSSPRCGYRRVSEDVIEVGAQRF